MTLSVACIGGVRSAADAARSAIGAESRSWLGGDLAVTTGEALDEQQLDALHDLRARGIAWTVVTTALTMGASSESPDPALMAVKAIDPQSYPLYGELTLEPPQPPSVALRPDTAAVSADALARFHLHLGDTILAGGTGFRIAAVIASETDRFSGVTALGVRCLLSQQGFERSGIARSGDSIRLRILFRLPPGADWTAIRQRLAGVFPEANLMDFREANRNAVSTLETTTDFLSLTALLAIALGAIGMAMASGQHIAQHAETLAVLKTLGGRNRQLTGIFFLQTAWLAAISFGLGLALGWGIRGLVLSLAGNYIRVPLGPFLDPTAVFDSGAMEVAALAPTLVGTALAIGRLKPALLLRNDFEAMPGRGSIGIAGLAWLIPPVALGVMTARLLGSWNLAAILVGSLASSVAAAFLLVRGLMHGGRWCGRHSALRRAPFLRHGIANLCRPGNRAEALIVTLAVGMMMIIATLQLNRAVTQSILEALPFDHPDLVIPAIEAELRDRVPEYLRHEPGVEKVELGAQARGLLTLPSGARVASLVGCAEETKEHARAMNAGGMVRLEISEDLARSFGVRIGSRLRFEAHGRMVRPTVTAIRRVDPVEAVWYPTRMDCSGINPPSLFYQVAARVRPGSIAAVRRAFIAEFPALPVFTAQDLSEMVGQASHDALLLVRVVSWYALGSSLAVLMAIVAASRGARLREMAILSALGVGRRTMIKLYTVEFAAMGMLACLVGSLLACGFTAVAVSSILRGIHMTVEWKALAISIVSACVLSAAAGWLPAYGLLRRKPMDVLRGE